MQKDKSVSFLILFMGLLVGFPALTTDIYLPGFPALTKFFNASASNIQMSLMATMLGIALGQLIIGPLSDKYGRKTPLMVSLIVFILTTLSCIFSTNIHSFIIFRFVQGLSCSSGMVISRAILADTFTGHKLVKSLSVNTAILGFTPAIAPIIGGVILTFLKWQGAFVFLLIISIVFLFSCFMLKESLPREKRNTDSSNSLVKNLLTTLNNRNYLRNVLIYAFSMSVMFAYISSSPFIFQEHYKITPLTYSIFFGINALALTFGALLSSRFKNQEIALQFGAFGLIFMSIVTVIILLSGVFYIFFEASIFTMFIFNGLIYPSSTTLALEYGRQNAGTASAILGSMSFLFGGLISPLVGLGNILYATSIAIILCSFIVVFLVLQRIFEEKRKPLRYAYSWVLNWFNTDRDF
jgi:MFS transporter, DHA1 family, multidrug resistance protein